jgi:malate permease and related proteins
MDYSQIISSILVLAAIIFIGLVISKLNILTEEGASAISGVIMKLTFPAIILISMQKSFTKELFENSIGLIALSVAIYIVLIIAATMLGRTSKLCEEKLKMMQFLTVFGNVSFMGFPLASAVYGDTGIFYASCFNMFYNLLMFSYGIMVLDKGGRGIDVKKLVNPGLVATVIGFAFFLASFKLPYIIYKPLEWVGDMTIPLALLTVGNSFARMHIRDLFNEPLIWIYSAQRLMIFPCILMVILKLAGFSSYLLVIPVIIMATPAPLTAGVFAKMYGGDELLANKSIVLSNFLAIITVPLVIFLTGSRL